MTRQLENRVTAVADDVDELRDELHELRAFVMDTDPTEADQPEDGAADPEAASEVEVVDRDGGGWRTVRNTVTGEERRVQGHEAEAQARRELTS